MYFTLINNSSKDLLNINLQDLIETTSTPCKANVKAGEQLSFSGRDITLSRIKRKMKVFCSSLEVPHGGPDGVKLLVSEFPPEE